MNLFSSSTSARLSRCVAASGLIALIGCQSSPAVTSDSPSRRSATSSAQLSNEFTATAEVTAVDRERRSVTLRRADGKLAKLQIGPAARNFEQIAAGDQVRARFVESLTATVRPPGETAEPLEGAAGFARTAAGEKPGAGVGVVASVRAKIESIDLEQHLVVFSLASGELIAHRIATAEGRAFAQGLVIGDVVQLDYAEAMVLSVDKL